jgi:guanylate kinase
MHGNEAVIVPIYTTRAPRVDDVLGHYRYISKRQFFALNEGRQFFISRLAPFPQYGWMGSDVRKAVETGRIVVMLFRHGGISFLKGILPKMMLVLIEPQPEMAMEHSVGRIKVKEEIDAHNVIETNRQLFARAMEAGWCGLVVANSFLGQREIDSHADMIINWARTVRKEWQDDILGSSK